jgi:hypothetical protein
MMGILKWVLEGAQVRDSTVRGCQGHEVHQAGGRTRADGRDRRASSGMFGGERELESSGGQLDSSGLAEVLS